MVRRVSKKKGGLGIQNVQKGTCFLETRWVVFNMQNLNYGLKLWSTFVKLSKQFIIIFISFTFIRGNYLSDSMYFKTGGIHISAIYNL